MLALFIDCLLPLLGCLAGAEEAGPGKSLARGVVFEDSDGDGSRGPAERGIPEVAVSNGRDVVLTDAEGRYSLSVTDDCAIFVIKPAGWGVPTSPETGIPRHFYLHKPFGSPGLRYPGVLPTGELPDSIDFPLRQEEDPELFRMICFGDTQPRDQREVDFTSHDVVEELIGFPAAFGVTLGDLAFDDLSLLEPIAKSVGLIGVPWHHVMGNHDENYDAPSVEQADESYERVFGPSCHAFNHGKVHFVVLNDVVLEVGSSRYHAEIGERQLAFLENDLALVPEDHLVVLMMHIPLPQLRDRARLLALLSQRPHTLSLSAHTHTHYHQFLSGDGWQREEPHHHLVHGTACGSWWAGAPDELGLPHTSMADGTPNGYSIITFDGNRYSVRWKAARRPADYQMNIYAPEVIAAEDAAKTVVVVNVFNGSARSNVEMRIEGLSDWINMAYAPGIDPGMERLREQAFELANTILSTEEPGASFEPGNRDQVKTLNRFQPFVGRALSKPAECPHLWKAVLPASLSAGYHVLTVREVDMFGQEHRGVRVIRVE